MIFLRPWLLLLLIVPVLFYFIRRKVSGVTRWEKIIDKCLLPYLLIQGDTIQTRIRSIWEAFIWILLTVAAAGPAWHKVPVPTQTGQPATVIIMELTPAMSGSYLKQAQLKLYDLLTNLQSDQVGLVLYDTMGYTASPITPDLDIIRGMIPSLTPHVLPDSSKAINIGAAIHQADILFQNTGKKNGRILIITTGAISLSEVQSAIHKLPYSIGILGIGKGDKSPIPLPQGGFLSDEKGKPLLMDLTAAQMNRVGTFVKSTPDESDIIHLIKSTSVTAGKNDGTNTPETIIIWQDMGIYFLLPALILFLFLFRKGLYFIFLIAFWILPTNAGFWTRSDQDDYQRQLAGIEAYRSENYEKAASLFTTGTSTDAIYNLGNAFAFQEKIDDAIAAYERVLSRDPTHKDALYNKEYLEKFKQSEASGNSPNESDQNTDNSNKDEQDSSQDPQQENSDNSTDSEAQEEQSTDMGQEQESQSNPSDQQEDQQNKPAQQNESEPSEETPMTRQIQFEQTNEDPFDQESRQLLNRLKPDPARVLRYRIYQQREKR